MYPRLGFHLEHNSLNFQTIWKLDESKKIEGRNTPPQPLRKSP